ncbi:HIT domain-containing protein [Phenylobacterium deserti]|uniref:Diadenosine tetraphosphate hydrolase n=1 Tax=Phenylobacterium deserti TaxID=1914756 RepID=A0A328AT49_9CAUL|nr:HIT domain-containing protein [Phenylobacterium deserti]RAK57445.1 diadenosine tetraphosphate hydrolase [Phenylobacterium deserti]
MFELDPAFVATSESLGELPLCHARLQADARYAWIVLIPRLASVVELEDLSPDDRARLLDEILLAGQAVRAVGEALARPVQKLNVGQLGNVTRQLHVHVLGRRDDDPAWPGPVWGHSPAQAFDRQALAAATLAARRTLGV